MNREIILIIIAVIWTLPWKGVALWKSARRGDTAWFIVLLIINTLAILEILYIIVFYKKRKKEEVMPDNTRRNLPVKII